MARAKSFPDRPPVGGANRSEDAMKDSYQREGKSHHQELLTNVWTLHFELSVLLVVVVTCLNGPPEGGAVKNERRNSGREKP